MKRLYLFLLCFILAASLSAQDKKTALGLGAEFNMNSREKFAAGAALSFDYALPLSLAAGLNITASNNFKGFTVIEPAAAFRWYFLNRQHTGLFLQAEGGLFLSIDEEGASPMPLGGLRAGVRLPAGMNFYIEPFGRVGYPFVFGVGLAAGIRLPAERASSRRTRDGSDIKEDTFIEAYGGIGSEEFTGGIRIVSDSDDNIHIQVTTINFRANSADYEGLSPEIIAGNNAIFTQIAEFLNRHTNYRITIEGHANATFPEGAARNREEQTLRQLSGQRALVAAQELMRRGVDRDRINYTGRGASAMLAPYDDAANNWKNRRVEFVLVRID